MSPDRLSSMIPTAAAMNSRTLLETDSGMAFRGNLHALPVRTEKPPMPCGQASVIVMLVGSLAVMRLKLIPEFALSSMAFQNDNNLQSREFIFRMELLCLPTL